MTERVPSVTVMVCVPAVLRVAPKELDPPESPEEAGMDPFESVEVNWRTPG